MSAASSTRSPSTSIPVSGIDSFDVPSFEAALASLLKDPSMFLDPSSIAKSTDPLTILEIQSVRKLSDAFSMLCSRGGLINHLGSVFDYVTPPSEQASTIDPKSISRSRDDDGFTAGDRSSALSAIADKFSENEAWHAQVDETFRTARDQLEANLKAITAMCNLEFGQDRRLEHMRQVLKRGTQAEEPLSEAEDRRLRGTDWGLFHSFVVFCVRDELHNSVHHESFDPTYPELQMDNYEKMFAQGEHSALLQTVSSHVTRLKDKLEVEVWLRKRFTLDVITRWMHAVGIGGNLALFEATRDTKMPLDADCDEDALGRFDEPESDDMEFLRKTMKASVEYRASSAAKKLVGEEWLRENSSALDHAKARYRSGRRPKL